MNKKEAQEYLLGILTSLKKTTQAREALEKEHELWKNRVALAQKHNRQDLLQGAQEKFTQIELETEDLRLQEKEMAQEAQKAKDEYKMAGLTERSIDTDRLLAELHMLAGNNPDGSRPGVKGGIDGSQNSAAQPADNYTENQDPLNQAIQELTLEQELTNLKNDIQKEKSENEQK